MKWLGYAEGVMNTELLTQNHDNSTYFFLKTKDGRPFLFEKAR